MTRQILCTKCAAHPCYTVTYKGEWSFRMAGTLAVTGYCDGCAKVLEPGESVKCYACGLGDKMPAGAMAWAADYVY